MSSDRSRYMPNDLLGRLAGLRLLAVEFVLNYLRLHFDGDANDPQPILICEAWPIVELSDGSTYRDGSVGYADALRSLVGTSVISTQERTGVGIRIDLDGGTVRLHPSIDELTGPEIAMLSGFADRSWMCWRPGEDSFEDLA